MYSKLIEFVENLVSENPMITFNVTKKNNLTLFGIDSVADESYVSLKAMSDEIGLKCRLIPKGTIIDNKPTVDTMVSIVKPTEQDISKLKGLFA
tara:strand:- start:74 stop:355 length:282 start_codon:yes stop_codon:yes gene_type:complete